ncbi:MAG: peptide ABC transporter substrate-binding protein [Dehalococcoidia bacterium]
MQLRLRGVVMPLALALTALVAGACGGGGSSGTTSAPAGTGGGASTVDQSRTPVAAATGYTPADKAQQVLRVSFTAQPVFLDPHKSQFAQDIAMERMMWRPLFWVDEQGAAVPSVAKEMPTQQNGGISADGKTWKITLKDGQKFSDGSALTAKDFEYSIKRALNPKLASPYADELGNVIGAREFNRAKDASGADLDRLRDAVGVKALDDKTLEVRLVQPQPTLSLVLGLWIAYPVKQSIVEQGGDAIENTKWAATVGRAVGNGPFVLKEAKEKDRYIFEANPNYTLDPKPKLSRLEFRIVEDEETGFNAFQTNEVDYAAVPTSKISLVDGDAQLKKLNLRATDPTVFWLQMQNQVKPLDNPKVRLALAKAINRDDFVKVVLGGVGEPTTLLMHTSTPGQKPTDGDALKFDPARAKQLLTEAGYPNGQGFPQLTYLSNQSTINKAAAEFIQKQFKDNLNIDIKLEIVDSQTRSSRYSNSQFELTLGGWHEDYHDPENWLPVLFRTGGTNNQLKYSNKQFDDLIDQAKFEPNTEKRYALYQQASKIALDDAAPARSTSACVTPWCGTRCAV